MTDIEYNLIFDIQSYWHSGSGKGGGSLLDSLVVTDDNLVPHLPGKSVKGLVREALRMTESLGHIVDGTTHQLCGGEHQLTESNSHTFGQAGFLRFSNAQVSESLRQWMTENSEAAQFMTTELHSTAIESTTGVAVNRSLRDIQVNIPMQLTAKVRIVKSEHLPSDWIQSIDMALPLIRSIGASRHRGLGRCQVTWEKK